MIPIGIIGSIRYISTMALNDAEIENLLRGDMSDIEDFNDDEDDLNEEQIITKHIAEMTEFIDLNNAEMDNLEREQCLLDGEISLTQDLLNQSDNTEEADVEKENEEQLPANWVTGSWENQKYPFNNMISAPPVEPYTPLEYFKQLFDSKIVENIAYQTNLYSVQKNGSSINTNSNEMEQFFGKHMCMSVIKMPAYRMYWAQYTKYSMISDTMSRNRFTALRTYVHFNDNTNCFPSTDVRHDKLFKIRPFIDAIQHIFKLIEPEEHLAIDEIIIPFKGRSSMKLYNKSKPHKWGIKMFALASKSGIVHDFEIYVGKGTVKSNTNLGLSGDIAIHLSEIIPKNKNFKLSFDNWFTSYNLVVSLKNHGILGVGTVRSNRLSGCQFENDKNLKKSRRGSYDTKIDTINVIVACKWFDNKTVHLVSNYMSMADKLRIPIERPAIVKEYNSFMGAIDLHDMLVEIYRTDIKLNSWLMYKRHCKQLDIIKHDSLLIFKMNIALGLLKAGKDKINTRKSYFDTT
ncbi:hypothetical protein AGLY_014181, partial [Aphis glycines]